MSTFPPTFLWGASTSPHQIEGNNVNSDWWAREGLVPGMEPSGDANDSYHRYREDMEMLAGAGLTSYRFGIEWARIEPRPGQFSNAELAHYRRMIDTALELDLTPVVTLHHFSNPRWFAEEGGWLSPTATERFAAYVTKASEILDGVKWVITINEPNMMAMMVMLQEAMRAGQLSQWQSPTVEGESDRDRIAAALPVPTPEYARPFIAAHLAARAIIRKRTDAKVGWSIANGALYSTPENAAKLMEVRHSGEDLYLEASVGDDFIGVQAYSAQEVDANGLVPHPEHPDNTITGAAYRPDALGTAVRHAAAVTGLPVLVTENGIAATDDTRRIAYTTEALRHLESAIKDGIDVRGYLHWSLLDNYEWGHWGPTFGLVAVDRATFVRTPKPSLAWLGSVARTHGDSLGTA
ncbi:family 1 glycosylhydrolase [Microbacterium sp. zg.Y625]|uniref:glycoside hydrolase family 1 protein n=1 Tax=Microbacterium jiangjiandongii TaxID=3049071 RepID=UPI00214C41D6|nr:MULTISPECIES: family 1 glycosylhydrolase [unclassified Microbacterium]MCR2792739.1 family 1 glycosylhydrolase [Microbacterium sp. zg.Y625]WIM26717.1 family 1 glycosylhydrolase [Microbacterium sp. zg-Y625]